MKWSCELPVLYLTCVVLCLPRPCNGHEQATLNGQGRHSPKVYDVTLNFDDLATDKHGIGYHPADPKQSALHYESIYLQGFSVVDVSKAKLPDISDISCAEHSAPNALFGKVNEGRIWPRVSLNDLSNPYSPGSGHRDGSLLRTFSLADIRLKPTGVVKGNPGEAYVVIGITLLKLPPDPLEGDTDHGSTAADVFPGVLRGEPLWTTRNIENVFVGFSPGANVPIRMKLRQWLGDDWGKGMDVMEMTGMYLKLLDETKWEWAEEAWEFCVDDVVLAITEFAAEGSTDMEQLFENEPFKEFGPSDAHYFLVRNDGTISEQNDPDYLRFKGLMSARLSPEGARETSQS